ncbi:unnamed protein product [Brassica napus]|uniref:(rape) hypothetical protein n=1 Tax=Brassica napus TaxID=3708 RepID=A0A816VS97_BRANA|nr:unnamed protein product [Brassica napus]
MGSESDSIEEKAAARKEALRALRAAQELSESKEEGDGDDVAVVEEDGPAMKFRNYVPQDKELQDGKVRRSGCCTSTCSGEERGLTHLLTLLQRNRTGTSEEMSRRSLINSKGGLRRQCINSWRSMRKNVRQQKLMKRQQRAKRPDDMTV